MAGGPGSEAVDASSLTDPPPSLDGEVAAAATALAVDPPLAPHVAADLPHPSGERKASTYALAGLLIAVLLIVGMLGVRYLSFAVPTDPRPTTDEITVEVISLSLDGPTCLVWWNDTALLACERGAARLTMIPWSADNGLGTPAPLIEDLQNPHGAVRVNHSNGSVRLIISEAGQLRAWDLPANTSLSPTALGAPVILQSDLAIGNHQQNAIHQLPNGSLLWHSGSTCNLPCGSDDNTSARLLTVDPWTGNLSVVATGVRNSFDGAWVEGLGYVFTDNGKDWGGAWPPEEINLLESGADYGWDEATEDDPVPLGTLGPLATHTPHSSLNGLVVRPENSSLPGDEMTLYATVFGSWNTLVPVGQEIVRVDLVADVNASQGWSGTVEVLVEDVAGPLPLVFTPEGDLLVGEYLTGRLLLVKGTDAVV